MKLSENKKFIKELLKNFEIFEDDSDIYIRISKKSDYIFYNEDIYKNYMKFSYILELLKNIEISENDEDIKSLIDDILEYILSIFEE